MSDSTRYEVFITDRDVPLDRQRKVAFGEPTVSVTTRLPVRLVRILDAACARGHFQRAPAIRAILRQAIEYEGTEMVTGWSRTPLYEVEM